MESRRGAGDDGKSKSSSGYSNQLSSSIYSEARAPAPRHLPITVPYHDDPFYAGSSFHGAGNRRMSVGSLSVPQIMALERPFRDRFSGVHNLAPTYPGGPENVSIAGTSFSPSTRNLSSQMSDIASPFPSDVSNMMGCRPSIGDTPSHLRIPMRVPEVVKPLDQVAQPSEMPIGSLTHFQSPPTWGVVKVSNTPYSVTKQEIVQFFGRQARLIAPEKGCPVHIIMERSTAKTMDCYVEFNDVDDAKAAVNRINRIYETGRAPRIGNRHVDVELSSQDALLKDLFPRAKCIVWENGSPVRVPNTDLYSSGFTGFFTSEEIIGCLRHAEMPQRSPFCARCPQRTYESTISTLGKFPWHAVGLYTVTDRNLLFDMVNRQIKALVASINRTNIVGLDQRLLRDLLYSGLRCPAFNERMKYTLCVNSEDQTEILRFPDMGKWFPFDTLVKLPKFDEQTLLYYVKLISKGYFDPREFPALPNSFPQDNHGLISPYGPIWFEWPVHLAKSTLWKDAVQQEMVILCNMVLGGWAKVNNEFRLQSEALEELGRRMSAVTMSNETASSRNISPQDTTKSRATEDTSRSLIPGFRHNPNAPYVTPICRPTNKAGRHVSFSDVRAFNHNDLTSTTPTRPPRRGGFRGGFGHRNTLSLNLPTSQLLEE